MILIEENLEQLLFSFISLLYSPMRYMRQIWLDGLQLVHPLNENLATKKEC